MNQPNHKLDDLACLICMPNMTKYYESMIIYSAKLGDLGKY